MKIIAPNFTENHLSEIHQTTKAKFSFFTYTEDGNIQRTHEWCHCRDFLGDVIFANRYNKTFSIYEFNVSPTRTPISQEYLQLLVKFPSKEVRDIFLDNLDILHGIEEANKLPHTTITKITALTYTVVADKFWQRAIPFLSFYTFLLKAMMYKYENKENWEVELAGKSCIERQYINGNQEVFRKVKHNLQQIAAVDTSMLGLEKEENVTITAIHNYYGFVGSFMRHAVTKTTYAKAVGELK